MDQILNQVSRSTELCDVGRVKRIAEISMNEEEKVMFDHLGNALKVPVAVTEVMLTGL